MICLVKKWLIRWQKNCHVRTNVNKYCFYILSSSTLIIVVDLHILYESIPSSSYPLPRYHDTTSHYFNDAVSHSFMLIIIMTNLYVSPTTSTAAEMRAVIHMTETFKTKSSQLEIISAENEDLTSR